MTRALIVGPRDQMEGAIEALYALKLVHIVDHREGDGGLDIGKPLEQASAASEILVKLRSITSALRIEEEAKPVQESVGGDLRERILALELNISEEDAARKKTQGLVADLSRRIEEMGPFAQLPLSLEDYRGYDHLEVLAGKTAREIGGLETVTPDFEAFGATGFLVVFVRKADAPAMRDYLTQRGFVSVPVPEGTGSPRELLAQLVSERQRWEDRLSEIESRLGTLRERYAGFLVAARAHLEVQVEKAEAPLRFAATEHSFVVEGWVPAETFPHVKAAMDRIPGVFFSELETDEHSADPPILLRNVRPFRPFELLVKLFSIPNYHEIDPTFIVAMVFPLFFGLMIGDAGYGIAWLLVGMWLLRKLKEPGQFRDLVVTVTWGGVFSFLFGMFLFAEAFGIPFHAPPHAVTRAEEFNWSAILGIDIPIHASIEKLVQVADFIVLSLTAAFLHLGIGFGIGLFDEVRHSKKHAFGKVAWLLILFAMYVVMLARAARWPGLAQGIWNGPLAWFPHEGMIDEGIGFAAGNPLPMIAVYILVAGLGLLLATEGGLHVMEVFGLMANMISYARLAAVGIAKAAMAFAFNLLILETFIFPWIDTGNVVLLIAGLGIGVLFHMIIFLLGGISGYIQALRLNYVEFFLKFFKGAGTSFRPFGMRAKAEV